MIDCRCGEGDEGSKPAVEGLACLMFDNYVTESLLMGSTTILKLFAVGAKEREAENNYSNHQSHLCVSTYPLFGISKHGNEFNIELMDESEREELGWKLCVGE